MLCASGLTREASIDYWGLRLTLTPVGEVFNFLANRADDLQLARKDTSFPYVDVHPEQKACAGLPIAARARAMDADAGGRCIPGVGAGYIVDCCTARYHVLSVRGRGRVMHYRMYFRPQVPVSISVTYMPQ